jgi:hypothetical protein
VFPRSPFLDSFRFADDPGIGSVTDHERVSRYLSEGRTDNLRTAHNSTIIPTSQAMWKSEWPHSQRFVIAERKPGPVARRIVRTNTECPFCP